MLFVEDWFYTISDKFNKMSDLFDPIKYMVIFVEINDMPQITQAHVCAFMYNLEMRILIFPCFIQKINNGSRLADRFPSISVRLGSKLIPVADACSRIFYVSSKPTCVLHCK